jgi:putative DNA topoisomerase
MTKINTSLFSANEHALQQAYGDCPECDGALTLRHSKNGPFLGCNHYPKCDFTKPLREYEDSVIKVIDDSSCPECQHNLAIKKGRYGLFIGCTNFPECHHIESPKENIETKVDCPSCKKGELRKRSNKHGQHFYSCSTYPSCKYVVNDPPVAHLCPVCQWPIMLEKSSSGSCFLRCPQKTCQHKVEISDDTDQ